MSRAIASSSTSLTNLPISSLTTPVLCVASSSYLSSFLRTNGSTWRHVTPRSIGTDSSNIVHREWMDLRMFFSTFFLFQSNNSPVHNLRFVNQCPIPPNSTFLYSFTFLTLLHFLTVVTRYEFSTAGQTGNFWYHSHLSTQYCDGLRGAFVVYGIIS